MFDLIPLPVNAEITISINQDLLSQATQPEKDAALASLFIALSTAITKYGCDVDSSDPLNITVNRKGEVNEI